MNDPHDMDLNPPIPQWALEQRERARVLRLAGWTYEDIAEELSGGDHGITTPAGVYKWCHPEKTPAQIAAWMKKHLPDPHAWSLEQLAKHDSDALRRLEEANARELEYMRRKGYDR